MIEWSGVSQLQGCFFGNGINLRRDFVELGCSASKHGLGPPAHLFNETLSMIKSMDHLVSKMFTP